MRRIASIILLTLGGWVLMAEPIIAFMDFRQDNLWEAIMIGVFLGLAAIPLALGTLASPGNRRRELGLTILIAGGVAVFGGVAGAAVFLDPGFKPFMPPTTPNIGLSPVTGIVNLLLLAAIGWWLFRGTEAARRSP